MTTRVYDFNSVQASFAGIPIEGWADGDGITITRESDTFTSVVGLKGQVSRSATSDNRATIEFNLMNTSPTNAALSAVALADREAPGGAGIGALLIVDLSGTSLFTSGNAWIKRVPDPVFGREASTRTWTFEVDELRDFNGGNL